MEKPSRLAQIVKPQFIERRGNVELTPNGLRFTRSSTEIAQMKGGGIRGKVEGFSLASARRLRETLFRCDFRPAGMGVLGLCFTLPKEAKAGDGEDVWAYMRKHAKELFGGVVSLVWRKEVQRNGREHYHAVLWSSKPNPLPMAGALIRTWCKRVAAKCDNPDVVERKMLWTHFRGNDGFLDIDLPEGALIHVLESVPAFTVIDSQGQGVRYLIDHSSKHKKHQSATSGRAWGVWNRSRLPRLPSDASVHVRLSPREEMELARILRHLSRYWIQAPCVFGWRWCRGRQFKRGANIVADAMARDAVRRWMEKRGIIDPLLFRPARISNESPVLPGI